MNWMIDLKKSATMQSGEHRDENVKRKLEDMEHRMRSHNLAINLGMLEGETREN